LDDVFAKIAGLAQSCRFRDCRHDIEPGCAVRAAIDRGELAQGQLQRWKKLVTEESFNTQSLGERRAKGRATGKKVKSVKMDPPE
jgi:ribosome biogenesis GTPase